MKEKIVAGVTAVLLGLNVAADVFACPVQTRKKTLVVDENFTGLTSLYYDCGDNSVVNHVTCNVLGKGIGDHEDSLTSDHSGRCDFEVEGFTTEYNEELDETEYVPLESVTVQVQAVCCPE